MEQVTKSKLQKRKRSAIKSRTKKQGVQTGMTPEPEGTTRCKREELKDSDGIKHGLDT